MADAEEITIDKIAIEVSSEASRAIQDISALASALSKLESSTGGSATKLREVANSVSALQKSVNKLKFDKLKELNSIKLSKNLASGLTSIGQALRDITGDASEKLKSLTSLNDLTGVRIDPSMGSNLTKVSMALNSMPMDAVSRINQLSGLHSIDNIKISSSISSSLQKIAAGIASLPQDSGMRLSSLRYLQYLNGIKISSSISSNISKISKSVAELPEDAGARLRGLVSSIAPLSSLQNLRLSGVTKMLRELPEVLKNYETLNIGNLVSQLDMLIPRLTRLADASTRVKAAFTGMPTSFKTAAASARSVVGANTALAKTMDHVATSGLGTKISMAGVVAGTMQIARGMASCVTNVNDYIESMNLFNASMGQYTQQAMEYGQKVQDAMGIDLGEWARNQGVFMTLITGMGETADRAEVMSQQLTQLGYDIASFYNLKVDDAMLKIQSGIAGELEPLRRVGWDLSDVRMNAEAAALGLDMTTREMSQAEKVALRYHMIMTQVTITHGDMARTLMSPANQLRVLQAQINLASRAIGNLFIPMLNLILPYAIAAAKAIQILAKTIASFFGVDATFEVDYSTLDTSGIASGVDDLADSLEDAGSAASGANEKVKELKNTVMGFDELNKLSDTPEDSNAGGGGGGAGGVGAGGAGLDIPLETYDFMAGLTSKLGELTDELAQKFVHILPYIAAIGAGFATWKLANLISGWMDFAKTLGNNRFLRVAAGLALSVGGAVLATWEYMDAWNNGIDLSNLTGLLLGLSALVGGLFISFGKLGVGIGLVIAGLSLIVLGIKDVVENGLNLENIETILLGVLGLATGVWLVFGSMAGGIALIAGGFLLIGLGVADAMKNGFTQDNMLAIAAGLGAIGLGLLMINTTAGKVYFAVLTVVAGVAIAVLSFKTMYENGMNLENVTGVMAGIGIAALGAGILLGAAGAAVMLIAGGCGLLLATLEDIRNNGFTQDNLMGLVGSVALLAGGVGLLGLKFGALGVGIGLIVVGIALVIDGIKNMIEEGANTQSTIEMFVGFGLVAIGVALAISPIAGMIAGVVGGITMIGTAIYDAVQNGFTKETFAQVAAGIGLIALALIPIVGVPALVVAAIALVAWFIASNWETIKEIWGGICQWFDENVAQPFGEAWAGICATIEEWVGTAWVFMCSVWDGITSWFDENVSKPVGEAWSAICSTIEEWTSTAWMFVTGIWDGLCSWFDENVSKPLGQFWQTLCDDVSTWWDNTFGENGEIPKAAAQAYVAVTGAWEGVKGWFKERAEAVAKWWNDTFGENGSVPRFFATAYVTITGIWDNIKSWFKQRVDNVKTTFNNVFGENGSVPKFFSTAWETIKGVWNAVSSWFWNTVISPAQTNFQNVFGQNGSVTKFFSNAWAAIKGVWNAVSSWFWNNVISPAQTNFQNVFGSEGTVTKFFSGAWATIKGVWDTVSTWFDENVIQPIKNLFEGIFGDGEGSIKSMVEGAWNGIVGFFQDPFGTIANAIDTSIGQPAREMFLNTLPNLADESHRKVEQAFRNGVNMYLNAHMQIAGNYGAYDLSEHSVYDHIGRQLGSTGMFASGGFPTQGQLFLARESGPELVGELSNRTAVANNDQIIEGIEAGVTNALVKVLMTQNSGQEREQSITVPVYIGRDEIARATWRGQVDLARRGEINFEALMR